VILNGLLVFIEKDEATRVWWEGYAWAGALGVVMSFKAVAENAYFYNTIRAGWVLRSAVTTAIYRKSLRLSASARQRKTVGEIVNLMQLDSAKLEMFMTQVHSLWDGIFQIIGYMVILYVYIGPAAFVGLAVMVVAIPVMGKVMMSLQRLNRAVVKFTDERVKVTNECLQGVLGVKMAAWEENFISTIGAMRLKEFKAYTSVQQYSAFMFSFMSTVPAITGVAALSVYAVQDGDVNAAVLFASVVTFGQLRFPLLFYPNALAAYAAYKVATNPHLPYVV
jgi:ABC-type bacteriocin/lantibiotic exporter with double-glycine peptidase domain